MPSNGALGREGSDPKRCSGGMSETLSTSKNVTLVLTHVSAVEVTQQRAGSWEL